MDQLLLNREQVACAGIGRGMSKLRHRPGLNLANSFTSEIEVLTDLFEGARFATIKAEAQLENLAFAFVERSQETIDLVRQQRSSSSLER